MKSFWDKIEKILMVIGTITMFLLLITLCSNLVTMCNDVKTIKQQLEAPITINNKDIQTLKDLCKSVRAK